MLSYWLDSLWLVLASRRNPFEKQWLKVGETPQITYFLERLSEDSIWGRANVWRSEWSVLEDSPWIVFTLLQIFGATERKKVIPSMVRWHLPNEIIFICGNLQMPSKSLWNQSGMRCSALDSLQLLTLWYKNRHTFTAVLNTFDRICSQNIGWRVRYVRKLWV